MFAAPTTIYRRFALLLASLLAFSSAQAQAQFDFSGGFGAQRSNPEVTVESQFTPATAERPALLFVTANIADGFHAFAVDQGVLPNGGGGPMATAITLAPDAAAQIIGKWQPLEPPKTHVDQDIWTGLELREHYGKVTWFAPIKLPAGADPASLTISGSIAGQICNPNTCIPFEQPVTAKLGSGVALPPGTEIKTVAAAATQPTTTVAPFEQQSASVDAGPTPTTANVYDLSQVSLSDVEEGSLIYYLITAFFGGVILNVMPCVLPVIGLKVMSFVQQAGQSRAHALALNCWYSAGIVAVFMALATLAVTLQLGWGGQFGSAGFNIILIGVVFAMALSLLGMWEIPIPGFVGSGAAVEITEREGPTAAFLKGILTTLLATPCTGPFMAPALAWAVKQPAWMTFSVFGVLGLGMASPYLLIGAFPSLIRFLPKPGAWMEQFKKIMGLVLLATVVWLLTFIDTPLVVPTVALMVGIVAGCWWISQTPITAPTSQKAYSWITAVLLVIVTSLGSYGYLYKKVMLPRFEKKVAKFAEEQIGNERLRIARDLGSAQNDEQLRQIVAELTTEATSTDDQGWQNFSLAKLGQLTIGEGRTVLVDFTADWCLTCKTLEKLVLKTQPVQEAMTRANIVTMEADYTKRPDSIDRTIKALGGIGVPLVAIFPANDPYHPIVFSDGQYTKSAIIEAIAKATGNNELLSNKATTSGNAALR